MPSRPVADPVSRARSIHDKRPFSRAIFFTLVHYLCVIAFITCAVILFLHPTPMTLVKPLIASVIASALSWLFAFLRRRSARCPLCKGSPLLDSGAAKHVKASRLRPFNHGTTAVLGILFLNRFRCMYCGTPYDLQKPSAVERRRKG
ncbi:hypothetical protein OKA05_16715 [Luteolibacter arcticus]|uniref:Transposase IS204/IS1001/IS1096/IS1165 zinc-finger domain-containing protein n=1 Tax=Luteolibacter arcticus TaxID=1581411 RepID=A0ABT3GL21_9BACT|nr:hypothetical protein [Luteolibacter arcticus]MCW1924211.1 hypothetical protein [Luteolibacter arcticus]